MQSEKNPKKSSANQSLTIKSKSKTRPKIKTKTVKKTAHSSVRSQFTTHKSRTALPVQFNPVRSHLYEIQKIFINWNSNPNYSANPTEWDLKCGLHDWALWRTKLNETLIKACITPLKLNKSIKSLHEDEPNKSLINQPGFVYYTGFFGNKTALEPETFIFFGIPRARTSIQKTQEMNPEIGNEIQSRDTNLVKSFSKSKSQTDAVVGTNVKEKIKAYEITNSASNLNSESKKNVLRENPRNNNKRSLIRDIPASAHTSSIRNSHRFKSPPLPGHFGAEHKRDRSNDDDLKRDINVNSLIAKNASNANINQRSSVASSRLIQSNHFHKQESETQIALMSMPNEQINHIISDDTNSNPNAGQANVLKAAEGDITFHRHDDRKSAKQNSKTGKSTQSFNAVEKIVDGLKKNVNNQDKDKLTRKNTNLKPEAKEKIIKNEKYNYLSPLKNMLKSKSKIKAETDLEKKKLMKKIINKLCLDKKEKRKKFYKTNT